MCAEKLDRVCVCALLRSEGRCNNNEVTDALHDPVARATHFWKVYILTQCLLKMLMIFLLVTIS
jgi:hypothetical protein